MKLKVEFEIEEVEAVELVSILKKAVGYTQSKVLYKYTQEIIKDLSVSGKIVEYFISLLDQYTAKPITLESSFHYDLGFAKWWLSSSSGLAAFCNTTLENITPIYDLTYSKILAKEAVKCSTVKKAVDLMLGKIKNG